MPHELTRRWRLKPIDESTVERLTEELKISPLIARILTLRGFTDNDSTRCYLSSSLRSDLPSPFDMADMDAAVERIVDAVQQQRADRHLGRLRRRRHHRRVGAGFVLARDRRGADLPCAASHRRGLRPQHRGSEAAAKSAASISSSRWTAAFPMRAKWRRRARSVSISSSSIITSRRRSFRRAVAVINPHRKDCAFPDKGLCAAGLAFYLVIGLRAKLRDAGWFENSAAPDIRHYLDIVTLGTIADMVPLKGVNRTLIKRGLAELANSTRPGVVALKQVSGIAAGEVSAGQVGFRLGPRINAAGRVDYGIKVVELLTTESSEDAQRIAQELEAHNQERRVIEAQVLEQALAQASRAMSGGARHSLVLAGEGWHPGVLGIVASRIVEKFYRPTVVIGFNDGMGKGSARSIRGFHMVEGFRRCAAAWKNSAAMNMPAACRSGRSNWRDLPRHLKMPRGKRYRPNNCCRCLRSMRSWTFRRSRVAISCTASSTASTPSGKSVL